MPVAWIRPLFSPVQPDEAPRMSTLVPGHPSISMFGKKLVWPRLHKPSPRARPDPRPWRLKPLSVDSAAWRWQQPQEQIALPLQQAQLSQLPPPRPAQATANRELPIGLLPSRGGVDRDFKVYTEILMILRLCMPRDCPPMRPPPPQARGDVVCNCYDSRRRDDGGGGGSRDGGRLGLGILNQ
jgi:hypothetical protein